ncbi:MULTISPECIES: MerR family transcriptional regulator [Streptomyces]|jgi:DNA-binding transcriptional MerR regulator|nr:MULTISPECIES: MerR family transcriptional regulator [Streptomyces]MBK3385631.1 MerR family transcriptional regulator [Streptomyces sp. DEF147AK]MBK3391634.1 MerR family transcriptional regulator [Streptomyces sp. DEF1AK]QXQ26179.1 MerR family transcriptional regulator [Streptomyces albidoflavus]QXQ32109.1 MerR family transcriptional regulator [Streptomyces albidoflavus]RZE45414.1 MerR family transcriptional regulator [Streptomyces albidoflavus]
MMRIGELATRTHVSVRALRYYEEHALLTAERTPSGQRHYPESAVARIHLIQQLYAAGLSSRTIRDLLPCVLDGRATPELLHRLTAQRDHLTTKLAALTATRDTLDRVIANAETSLRTGEACGGGE